MPPRRNDENIFRRTIVEKSAPLADHVSCGYANSFIIIILFYFFLISFQLPRSLDVSASIVLLTKWKKVIFLPTQKYAIRKRRREREGKRERERHWKLKIWCNRRALEIVCFIHFSRWCRRIDAFVYTIMLSAYATLLAGRCMYGKYDIQRRNRIADVIRKLSMYECLCLPESVVPLLVRASVWVFSSFFLFLLSFCSVYLNDDEQFKFSCHSDDGRLTGNFPFICSL